MYIGARRTLSQMHIMKKCVFTGNGDLLKKNLRPIEGTRGNTTPLNPPLFPWFGIQAYIHYNDDFKIGGYRRILNVLSF